MWVCGHISMVACYVTFLSVWCIYGVWWNEQVNEQLNLERKRERERVTIFHKRGGGEEEEKGKFNS